MQTIKIATIQTNLFWQDAVKNRAQFSEKINNHQQQADIFVLPEMFTTGFSMNPMELAETMQGETVSWMIGLAKESNAAICGSLIIEETGKYYNRFVFAEPNGALKIYNKRHTFTLAGEDKIYTAGQEKVIFEYQGWRICPLVCYDLRFPVWARNTEDYDVLIYVANWPKPRVNAWDALLKARAIENMTYCVGVNRVGADANNHLYTGHSVVYNGLGEPLSEIVEHEHIQIVTLDKNHLTTIRSKFKFLEDKDDFILK